MTEFTFYKLCDYFEFLDDLRSSGEVNMFGAAPYVARAYPELDIKQARRVLSLWQNTFSAEPLEERVSTAQTKGAA